MPIGLIVGMFIALSVTINRAHNGNKSLVLKAGDKVIISNDGRIRVEWADAPAPVEPDLPSTNPLGSGPADESHEQEDASR